MFSSCSPTSALVDGVKIGSGSREPSTRPAGSGMPHTVPRRAVLGQPGAGEVAAGDALDREHVQLLAEHRPAVDGGGHPASTVEASTWCATSASWSNHHRLSCGQDAALVRDLAGEDVVVGTDAVAGDHQDARPGRGVRMAGPRGRRGRGPCRSRRAASRAGPAAGVSRLGACGLSRRSSRPSAAGSASSAGSRPARGRSIWPRAACAAMSVR